MHRHSEHQREQIVARIREQLTNLFAIDDFSGIELFGLIQHLSQLVEMLDNQPEDEVDLSGPRFRLMLRLLIDEEMGSSAGITPTSLSHTQRVSRNTISALLRGLEDQGLIRRTLDPADLRVFRIHLTPQGRELILKSAPRRITGFNQMLSGLTTAEREQLTALLVRLHRSLIEQVHACHPADVSTSKD